MTIVDILWGSDHLRPGQFNCKLANKMKFVSLIISILICQLAGLVGTIFTTPAIPTWYAGLEKPDFSPPNWLFGPVWITLYTFMGIAAWLVWQQGVKNKPIKTALLFFGVQLLFNSLWSILFFGLKSPFLALIEILVLWVLILLTIITFFKVSKPAGRLLLPYLFWVSFAALLNFFIYRLN